MRNDAAVRRRSNWRLRTSRSAVASPTFAAALACAVATAHGQTAPADAGAMPTADLPTVNVKASADASAAGLSPAYPGGQVARGGRAGILGTRDNQDTPFSITSYTNELIQDRQAKSVGDVLQSDPTVRMARGFGNFQEAYFIRGFILGSDDVAYNGLYSLLPRQYIATELFERVEVLRGASAFLTGATPGGDGIGGAINLLPKRATNEPLTRATLGAGSGGQVNGAVDVARRFGPEQRAGVRFNAALRDGGTAADDEKARLELLALGLDWRDRDVRLSGDLGWQNNRLKQTRPNVSLGGAVTAVPSVPDASANFAQPWSYSNERDLFGTLRGEYDLSPSITAWAAYGLRRSNEANSLANLDLNDATGGAATVARFDNTRKDKVDTGEIGVRGKFTTGPVGHEWVASAARFELETKNAYAYDFFNTLATNLYTPVSYPQPAFGANAFVGNALDDPALTHRTKLTSYALADTLALFDAQVLLTLGARHQKLVDENFAYGTGAPATPYDESRTSPIGAVVWKVRRDLSLYANHIEALTQGETAPTFATPPAVAPPVNQGERLPPYVSKQNEVGAKYDGGRIGGSVALFSTTRPRALVDAGNVFTAAGEDRHRGMELTVFGQPAASLQLLGGASWIQAEQRQTGAAATDGKRVIGVPRWQANLGAEWQLPGVTGWALDGRVVYTGSRYADAVNTLNVPSWTRLDAGVRYFADVQGRLVTLRARVENLADRNYWASSGGYPGAGYLVVGLPRSFSLSASVDF